MLAVFCVFYVKGWVTHGHVSDMAVHPNVRYAHQTLAVKMQKDAISLVR